LLAWTKDIPDEKMKIAMSIIIAITPAAYQANPTLMIYLILKQVELSVKYGNVPESSYSYTAYGFILCGVVGDIDTGYRFGQLGLELVKKFGNTGVVARTILVYNYLVEIWKKPLRDTTDALLENYHTGLGIGDLEFAAYSIYCYIYHAFTAGKPLKDLDTEIDEYALLVSKLKHEGVVNWLSIFKNVFTMLRSDSKYRELQESEKEEELRISNYKAANDRTAICHSYLTKSIMNYMWYDYDTALKYIDLSAEYIDSLTSSVAVTILNFYDSLVRLALYKDSSAKVKKDIMQNVSSNQEQLKIWSAHSRQNFLHKYYLVEAEIGRVTGELSAIDLYEQAISAARESKYVQEVALSYELAARFYKERNLTTSANAYIREAYGFYGDWGARAKVVQLEEQYSGVFIKAQPASNQMVAIGGSSTCTAGALDELSVIKMSQALSREVHIDLLLKKIIEIAIENAGADKGLLIVNDRGRQIIQASKKIGMDSAKTMLDIPVEESADLPQSIINYVINSEAHVVINDIESDVTYSNDKYFKTNTPKSVMCIPLLSQGDLCGLIYLENNQIPDTFNDVRITFLEVLGAQAAIAIENASAYKRLKIERDFSSSIMKNTPDMICGIDGDGEAFFVNAAVEKTTGYSAAELIGQSWWQIFYPGDEYGQVEKLFTELASGEVKDYEMKLICKDGTTKSVLWTSMTQRDKNGNISELFGFARDITERKKAEALIVQSRDKYESLVANIPGITYRCLADNDWTMTYMSEQSYAITGYPAQEFIENKVRPFVSIINKDDYKNVERMAIEAIENKKPWEYEYRICCKDGTTRILYEKGKAIFNSSGDVEFLDGFILDITERKHLENMMVQTEKLQSVAGLAAGMAHEINNPLGGITQGYQNILNRIDPDKPKNQEIAKKLNLNLYDMYKYLEERKIVTFINGGRDCCERAAGIVKNMLMFSRKSDSAHIPVMLSDLIDHTIELGSTDYDMKKKYDFKFVEIVKEYDEDLPTVNCSSNEIEQVLLNLFKNALQAMEEVSIDGYKPKFHIRLKKEPGYIRIEIEDNGPGIPDDVKKRIFEPFYTTKPTGVGTGLGLSVSYSIITHNHSGTFEVKSEVGKGTKFIIRLPLSQ